MTMRTALHTAGAVEGALDGRLDSASLWALNGPGPLDVRTGVVFAPGSPMLVQGTSATSPWAVTVNPGHVIGSKGISNGPYVACNDALATVSLANPDATNPRIDVIYAMQKDTAAIINADGTTAATLAAVTGTPSATPAVPSAPVGAVVLAQVQIGNATTATAGTSGAGVTITQQWQWTTVRGEPIPTRTQAERDAITWGTAATPAEVRRLDTGTVERNSGSGWSIITWGGAWSTYSPSYVNLTLGTGGTILGRWRQIGSTIDAYIVITFGSSGFAIDGAYIGVPVQSGTVDAGGLLGYGEAYHVSGPAWWPLLATVSGSTFLVISAASGTSMTATAPFTVAASDRIEMRLRYEV